MTSPALRHRQQKLARLSTRAHLDDMARRARAGVAAPMPEDGPVATEYQGLLAQLHEDLRGLSSVQSIEKRIEKKPELLAKYRPWVAGALDVAEGDAAPQDEIVVTALIWALDIADWSFALDIADHCIAHRLDLPERYNRTLGCLVVEEVAEAAIKAGGNVPHDVLERVRPIATDEDMPDQVRAKFHRALGESWAQRAENFDPASESAPAGGKPAMVDAALTELRRAVELNAKVGVKKLIEQLEREAKRLAEAAGASSST
jgi:hypothetical protein